jgi:hypothetical protein
MLLLLRKDLVPRLTQANTRYLSQTLAVLSTPRKPAYFVPRNSQGNLPVYTDFRNNGARHFVLVRNIDGSAEVDDYIVHRAELTVSASTGSCQGPGEFTLCQWVGR